VPHLVVPTKVGPDCFFALLEAKQISAANVDFDAGRST
jgi:hypothetical protein